MSEQKTFTVTFIYTDDDGKKQEKKCTAYEGEALLDVAERYGVFIEHACERSLACSTCHCILDKKSYVKFPVASEDEEILLDTAFQPTPLSRLACQLFVTSDCTIQIPNKNRNLA